LKKVLHILLLAVALSLNGQSWAQVPWTVVPTSQSQIIVLKSLDSTASYDSSFSTIGDAIGFFYDQSGTWVCAGYLELDGVTDSLTVYGKDSLYNGYQNLETYHIKYWRKSKNCIIDAPSALMSDNQYSTWGSDTIIKLSAFPATVMYPQEHYCTNNTAVLPIPLQITGTTFFNLSFNIQPSGMNGFNPSNGNIDSLSTIVPGTYTMHMITLDSMCLRNDSIMITISNKLGSSPVISVKQPDCSYNAGTVTLDTSTIFQGVKPYLISLRNTVTGVAVSGPSGLFTGLLPGNNYQLIIQDQGLCTDTINVIIQPSPVICDSNGVSDILTPFENNAYSHIFLPWKGLTKIYNSQGELINSFVTPAAWDGKTQGGEYVKTGLYFIFTEGEKKKEITVIY
jgi:hypothetical protein